MILLGLCLAYAVIVTMVAPLLLTCGRWQIWRPRLALACWHAALATGVGAFLFSALYGIVMVYRHGLHGAGMHAVIFTIATWAGVALLVAFGALLLGRSEPVVRRERGLISHLQDAALNCRQSTENRDGATVRVIESDALVAYSFHAEQATVIISRGLRRHLSESEVDVIIAHERAHLDLRHHWAVRVAQVNVACLPHFPPARRLSNSTRLLIELIADDAAVARCGPERVRSALSLMDTFSDRPELSLRAERVAAAARAAA